MSRVESTAAEEGPLWSKTARIWVDYWARLGAPARELLASRTAVGDAKRILDMGCGSGEFCALAAQRGAEVAGIDAAEGMLDLARERVPHGDLRVGAIEDLPWDDDSFDVVTGFNSFQFAADPAAPFAEARRVTRPGGLVAVCVWGPRRENELPRLFDVIRALDEEDEGQAPSDEPKLGDPGQLESRVREAGMAVLDTGLVDVAYVAADLRELERALELDLIHGGNAESVDRAAFRRAVATGAEDALQPDGSFRFENRFRWVLAQK